MRLTDEQLHRLVASDPSDESALKELRERVRWNAIRSLPNPTGTCGHGERVYADNRGAMSSGYVAHEKGHSVCNKGYGLDVVWDPDTPRVAALKALIHDLRPDWQRRC